MCPIMIIDGIRCQNVAELEEVCPRGIVMSGIQVRHDHQRCLCEVDIDGTATVNELAVVGVGGDEHEFRSNHK